MKQLNFFEQLPTKPAEGIEVYELVINGPIFPTKHPITGETCILLLATSQTQREPGKKKGKTRYVKRACYCVGNVWQAFLSVKKKQKLRTLSRDEQAKEMSFMLDKNKKIRVKGKSAPGLEYEQKKKGKPSVFWDVMLVTSVELVLPPSLKKVDEPFFHNKFGYGEPEVEF